MFVMLLVPAYDLQIPPWGFVDGFHSARFFVADFFSQYFECQWLPFAGIMAPAGSSCPSYQHVTL
jgi:hypothetical protein